MGTNAKSIQSMRDLTIYNHTPLKIEINGIASVAIKSANTPVMVFDAADGTIEINTDDFTPATYTVQYFDANDEIQGTSTLEVKQHLKYASQDYDPRSHAEIALQAITAFMEGRATAQQRHIRVGDKEIEYSSFDQLMKWKNHFERQVRMQHGKPATIRHEYIKVIER